MWLLRIKNLTKSEAMDIIFGGVEYETVRGEEHILYEKKKHLLDDLKYAKKVSLKNINYEIEKAVFTKLA